MNKRSIYLAVIYSILVIVFKLYIIYRGLALTKFGFNYAHILTVACIVPFLFLAIKQYRDKESGGVIGGKVALKQAMTVALISAILLSAYCYFEFEYKWKEISSEYYHGDAYHKKYDEFYAQNPNAKKETFENVVKYNIENLSAFRFMTVRLLSFLLLSFSASFILAVFMKKR